MLRRDPPAEMTRPRRARRASAILTLLAALTACSGATTDGLKPVDREAESALIIEQVFRYAIHQFAPKGSAGGALCLAVREGASLTDPVPSIMDRLRNGQVQPRSSCTTAPTLIAGPIEWLRDDEVKVKGGYARAPEGEVRLVYRVVRESGGWVCLGPIVSSDPL